MESTVFEPSEYEVETIHVDPIRHPVIEEEEEDEDDRERKVALQKLLEQGMNLSSSSDDYGDDDDSLQPNSNDYSENGDNLGDGQRNYQGHHNLDGYQYNENQNSEPLTDGHNHNGCYTQEHVNFIGQEDHGLREAAGLPEEYNVNHRLYNGFQGHCNGESVWSGESDHSGNFVTNTSMVKSPSRFHINLNEVVSQSDMSSAKEHPVSYENESNNSSLHEENTYSYKPIESNGRQREFLSSETSYERHKILYEARGQEIDSLTEEISKIRRQSSQEINFLKQRLHSLTTEKEDLLTSRTQSNILLNENEEKIRNLSSELSEKEKLLETCETENKKLHEKINVAEGTISSLELQVAELQAVDTIARNRQDHESFLKKLQYSHREQIEDLKRKVHLSKKRVEELECQVRPMEEDLKTIRKSKEIALQEKAELCHQLTNSLEAAQQQIKIMLNAKRSDISFSAENEETKNRLFSAEAKIKKYETELEHFNMLLKMGLFSFAEFSSNPEDSINQLKLSKALTFDEPKLTQKSYVAQKATTANFSNSDVMERLKKELLRSLYNNNKHTKEIQELTSDISDKEEKIREQQSVIKSLNVDLKGQRSLSLTNRENPDLLIAIEENSYLKNEIATFVQNYSTMKDKADHMIKSLNEFLKMDKFSSERVLALPTVSEAIREYTQNLEEFGNFRMQSWEKLKKENLELHSKRYLALDKLGGIIAALKDLKNDIRLRGGAMESQDGLTLKQQIDSFSSNVKELILEVQEYFNDSVKRKNELWTLHLKFERTSDENFEIKTKIKNLEDESNKFKTQHNLALNDCKEKYMKFHEESIFMMKEQLKKEYNKIIASLKEKINQMQNKITEIQNHYISVCEENTKYEELYRHVQSEKVSTANANEKTIPFHNSSQEALREIKDKHTKEIQEMLSEAHSSHSKQESEFKEALKEWQLKYSQRENELKEVINEWQTQYTQREAEFNQQLEEIKLQVDANARTGTDTQLRELNNIIEEKNNMENHYKREIDKLNNQIYNFLCSNGSIIAETKISIQNRFQEEINNLHSQINDLKSTKEELEKEKFNLKNKELDLVTQREILTRDHDELSRNWEMKLLKLNHDHEIELHKQSEKVQEIHLESLKTKDTEVLLKKQLDENHEKYFKYKKLYLETRIKCHKLLNKYKEKLEKNFQESQDVIQFIQNWLEKSRATLIGNLSEVISGLQTIPDKSVPNRILEHVDALKRIKSSMLKLSLHGSWFPNSEQNLNMKK